MSIVDDPESVQKVTRTSQIIVGAMTMGVIVFLALVFFIGEIAKPPGGDQELLGVPIMTLMGTVMGAVCLAASFFVPKLVVDGGLRGLAKSGASPTTKPGSKQVDPAAEAAQLMPLFQTQLIIGSALAEGPAFFASLAFMMEHHYLALGVAGVMLAALIARFPTADSVNGWLDENLGRLEQKRRDEI
ncbi:MAG: hypothetical protein P4L85_24290 [Paludisphaera borealis]|uniref:hypothetical protein n=1 Tax=Paludisphaera borealis TaxID=1387353 RepID=UPI00283E4EBB|nr:hypothetical protein [Paludisphaera borealis]MDR3622493.1 hypothetical protein [Paludisphaera borealis]